MASQNNICIILQAMYSQRITISIVCENPLSQNEACVTLQAMHLQRIILSTKFDTSGT